MEILENALGPTDLDEYQEAAPSAAEAKPSPKTADKKTRPSGASQRRYIAKNLIALVVRPYNKRYQLQALCFGEEPKLFQAPSGFVSQEAKDICQKCPVNTDCLEAGLLQPRSDTSVYNGTGSADRQRILEERIAEFNASQAT